MKVKAIQLLCKASLSCITLCVMLSNLSSKAVEQAAVKEKETGSGDVAALLTRYDVKKEYNTVFRKVLKNYVADAIANENNIMAEAYFEQEQPSIVWIIERWNSRDNFDRYGKTQQADAVSSMPKDVLLTPVQRMYVKDLEPVSKKQWRAIAAPADTPITIILFVDARPGTGGRFREIYHKAMPQFRTEPGVINYQISQLENDSNRFVTYEKFKSEDAFQYHLNFPPIQPVIEFLNTSIVKQPFQTGLHRLVPFPSNIQ